MSSPIQPISTIGPSAPSTSLPTLSSGPFAGLPDLNQIYGAPEGNSVPLLDSSSTNLPSLPAQDPGLQNLNPLPSLPSLGSTSTYGTDPLATALGNDPSLNAPIGAAQTAGNYLTGMTSNSLLGLSVGRVAAFALGLILIAGGIFLFRGVQQTVVRVGKTAAKVGAVAAA